jgi:hypothetical protein
MTRFDTEAALAAANPLTAQAADALALRDAEAELLEGIVAIPAHRSLRAPGREGARSGTGARRLRIGRRLGLVLTATAVVAAVLALLPGGERTGGPTPAFAASLVRFANNSPLVLLKAPGWHVVYTDEEPGGYGEMHFVHGSSAAAEPVSSVGNAQPASIQHLAAGVASLTWMPATARIRRYDAAGREHAPTGLGVDARRYVYEGGSRRAFDLSAYFVYRGRELHFRATVASMAIFRAELRALTPVSTTTWLQAMPASVVKTADNGEAVRAMLKGIPLPPGFDAARIHGIRLIHDRYQLGAAVTGDVACMWIGDWFRARRMDDQKAIRRAVAAMATSPHWPVFSWMSKQGAWPQVLISYAHAMPRDRIVEGSAHPLLPADVNDGLGCSQWGVKLG